MGFRLDELRLLDEALRHLDRWDESVRTYAQNVLGTKGEPHQDAALIKQLRDEAAQALAEEEEEDRLETEDLMGR